MIGVLVTSNTLYLHGNETAHNGGLLEVFILEDIQDSTGDRSPIWKLAETCIDLTLSFVISLIGVVTNILVIIVFLKQKFKDSVAVSMTAIAMWDFVKCLGCFLQRLTGPISLWDPGIAAIWSQLFVLYFTNLTCIVTHVSVVLATYVAVERCLCVSIPFKVKWLITSKTSFITCFIISVVVFVGLFILYIFYENIWVLSVSDSQTVAIYFNSDLYYPQQQPVFPFYNLCGIAMPVICFVIIVASRFVIIYHLRKSSNFFSVSTQAQCQQSQNQSQNHFSTRERQVVKMLLVIIIICAICLSPRIVYYIVKCFNNEFQVFHLYHHIFLLSTHIVNAFDLLNAAINLFVLMSMSSAFRATFQELFAVRYGLAPVNFRQSNVEKSDQK